MATAALDIVFCNGRLVELKNGSHRDILIEFLALEKKKFLL